MIMFEDSVSQADARARVQFSAHRGPSYATVSAEKPNALFEQRLDRIERTLELLVAAFESATPKPPTRITPTKPTPTKPKKNVTRHLRQSPEMSINELKRRCVQETSPVFTASADLSLNSELVIPDPHDDDEFEGTP